MPFDDTLHRGRVKHGLQVPNTMGLLSLVMAIHVRNEKCQVARNCQVTWIDSFYVYGGPFLVDEQPAQLQCLHSGCEDGLVIVWIRRWRTALARYVESDSIVEMRAGLIVLCPFLCMRWLEAIKRVDTSVESCSDALQNRGRPHTSTTSDCRPCARTCDTGAGIECCAS